MRYTTEDRGLINNFAVEPKTYAAEPPTTKQKNTNRVLAIGGVVIVIALCAFAATFS